MPIPLPNLDTRRWSDLVDEGRALIPRYAPAWTDYNVHDPGITLIELLAWLIERAMYQVNRIPDRHRLKFLALEGVTPHAPRPAKVALQFTLKSGTGTLDLPKGVMFDAGTIPYRTRAALTLTDALLMAVQVYDGSLYLDRTRTWSDGLPFLAFGANPSAASSPALLLGFDRALPKGKTVTLYFHVQGVRPDERERMRDEVEDVRADCRPASPTIDCTPCAPASDDWCANGAPTTPTPGAFGKPAIESLRYHSARLVWELGTASGWHALNAAADEVVDETCSLTLDGSVRLTITDDLVPQSVGAVAAKYWYVRARLASGAYDAAPVLLGVVINGVRAEQTEAACGQFVIAAGVTPTGAITPGLEIPLTFALDAGGTVVNLDVAPAASPNPPVRIVAYAAATTTTAGSITLALVSACVGTGFPDQRFQLATEAISRGHVRMYSLAIPDWNRWKLRRDFDASSSTEATMVVDATTAIAEAGDGAHGEVVPVGTSVVAAFDTTLAAAGRVGAGQSWALDTGMWNRALLGADPATIAPLLTTIANTAPSSGGHPQETLAHAMGRAAALLWSHELLIALCPTGACQTLDQLDPATVRASPVPIRASTTLDFERIAISVPDTRVRRARALPNVDPRYPCLDAPGAVTVIIVPELPMGRPQPSRGLLRVVQRYLDRRRVLCTRVMVVGPTYVIVSIATKVMAVVGADPARVRTDVIAALDDFLDPLVGGPLARGWPFGRDVYRNEILAVIDRAAGVDHVLSLTMTADSGEADCDNICVAPTALVASGTHAVDVATP